MNENRPPLVLLVAPTPSPTLERALASTGLRVVHSNEPREILEKLTELDIRLIVVDGRRFPRGAQEVATLLHEGMPENTLPTIVVVDDIDAAIEIFGSSSAVEILADERLLVHAVGRSLKTQKVHEDRRRAETRFSRARLMAGFASWEWSLETNRFACDLELLEIFDCGPIRGSVQVEDLLGQVHPSDAALVRTAFENRRPHQIEYRLSSTSARPIRTVLQEAELVQDQPNGEVRLLGTVLDISELKDAQTRIARLVYFDSLTGLPNRAYLNEHLARVIGAAQRNQERVAVMGLDLDLFKRVNDTLGHAAGDLLLREVANRISRAIRHGDSVVASGHGSVDLKPTTSSTTGVDRENTAVRLGGDEFIIILNRLNAPEDAEVVARRIADRLSKSVVIEGAEVFVSCSIGISLFPENSDSPEELLKQSDAAMYEAKEKGRNTFQFFSASIHERAMRRAKLENGLRGALEKDELRLVYQPKVKLSTGETVGAEALLRWTHLGEAISPGEFIPVAEDRGLIVPIGEWVLRHACAQIHAWTLAGRSIHVSINVSSRQFRESDFVDNVARILHETGVRPDLVELEITETCIMQTSERATRTLERLKALGVTIAVDDFGTGYSSLSYLGRLPIDTLKIDVEFVRSVVTNASCRAITSAIIALGRTLGLQIVAEGVESKKQIDYLLQQGCSFAQGFAFSRGIPPEELRSAYKAQPEDA
ncbi:MAG: EAL domain-containing protein [Deltaproteobacteria bacterium]|nr:EAL domain-containing protein [Deltaproteobacteria bacterium]